MLVPRFRTISAERDMTMNRAMAFYTEMHIADHFSPPSSTVDLRQTPGGK